MRLRRPLFMGTNVAALMGGVAAPVSTVAPAITGTATEGQTLTASTGTWSGSPTYTYQWKRAGASIGGATASTYLLVSADVGSTITVTVTATNAGGSASETSAATAAVFGPQSLVTPLVAGYLAGVGRWSDTAGTTPATTTIARWDDTLSGDDNHLIQATGANQPTIAAAARNSRDAIGKTSGQYLKIANWVGGTESTPLTIVFTHKHTGASGEEAIFDVGTSTPYAELYFFASPNDALNGFRSAATNVDITGWIRPTPWNLGVVAWNGATSKYGRNGWIGHEFNPGAPTDFKGLTLGALNNGAGGSAGQYGDVLVYRGDATADPLWPQLVAWLAARWATPSFAKVSAGANDSYFPSTILLDTGDVLCVHSYGTNQLNIDNVVKCSRSTDGGVTWSAPATILSDGDSSCLTNSGGMQLANLDAIATVVRGGVGGTPESAHLLRSTDRGINWTESSIACPAGYTWVYPYGRIREVTAGSLLYMPAYAKNSTTNLTDSLLLQSADNGVNWTLKSVIFAGTASPSRQPNETAVLNTTGTTWVAYYRDEGSTKIHTRTSTDGCATWGAESEFTPAAANGVSPDLIKLASGRVVLCVGQRSAPTAYLYGKGIRQFYSDDNCATWSRGQNLYGTEAATALPNDYGYPSAVELSAGQLLVCFYDADQDVRASRILEADLL